MKTRLKDRGNISDDIANSLRDMIFDGRLEAGSRINEVHLASDLGVSRTPLREALRSLAAEGALHIHPRRGFFVRELTVEEVENIYPIRAFLDPEALRISGIPPVDRTARLNALADELTRAQDVHRAIRLDDQWHFELWKECDNSTLVDLIRQFMRRTRRYELASMRESGTLRRSNESKLSITRALREGDLDSACLRLRNALLGGAEPVLEWLRSRV